MGTNYYHRTNICECCGRYDERHICKSLIDFEAVVEWQDEAPYDQVVTVGSWQDWTAFLLLTDGEVWNEYGEQFSVGEFISMVQATDSERRRWQYNWMLDNLPSEVSSGPAVDKTWLDPDGFTFSGRPFS